MLREGATYCNISDHNFATFAFSIARHLTFESSLLSLSTIGRVMYSDQTTEDERLNYHADLLSQLSNPKRLEVCIHLTGHEEDVNSLAKKLGISQSALSQHLTRLYHSGIVKVRRQAQFRYYTCDHPGVQQILKTLAELFDADAPKRVSDDAADKDDKS